MRKKKIPFLYHCTIFMLYYVCDLLMMPNVLSIIKSIKISDRVSMHLKLKEENHEKKKIFIAIPSIKISNERDNFFVVIIKR